MKEAFASLLLFLAGFYAPPLSVEPVLLGAQPAITVPQGGTGWSTIQRGTLLYGTGPDLRIGTTSTTTLTASAPLSLSNPVAKIGGSNSVLTIDTSGAWSGTAALATTLAANGANCSSGSAPLGVDASGAVESCFDVWTQAENTSAAYLSSVDISANTNLTAGDALTLTEDDIDFDGGATPSGDLGGTWASPSVTDNSHAHDATTISGLGTADISGLDMSDDTDLTAGDGITLTDDDLDCDTASASVFGCLSSADWTTFNNKADFAWPWSLQTYTGILYQATSSNMMASSTVAINATSTNATSTNLSVSGQVDFDQLTSAIVLTGSTGILAEYAGTSCTNQFVRSVSALGAATCATVGAADVSLANLTATDGTLTFSGTYTGATARTIGLNLGNANTWTALQTFSAASTTNLTASSFFAIPAAANPTVDVSGELAIDTTSASTSLRYFDGTAERVIHDIKSKVLPSLSTSTLAYKGSFGAAGTTTLRLWNPLRPITVVSIFCRTDTGTGHVDLHDGTNHTNDVACSTTGPLTTISTNNTWTMSENVNIDVGRSASSPNDFTITINYRETVD